MVRTDLRSGTFRVCETNRELTRNPDSLTSNQTIAYARGMTALEDLSIRRAVISEQKELEDFQLRASHPGPSAFAESDGVADNLPGEPGSSLVPDFPLSRP